MVALLNDLAEIQGQVIELREIARAQPHAEAEELKRLADRIEACAREIDGMA
jgi:hypothetical protein